MNCDNIEVYIWPAELWNFYLSHINDLKDKTYVIAENKVTGREVILHTDSANDSLGHLAVYDGDKLVYDEPFSGFDDAMITCRKVYGIYMVEKEKGSEESDDDLDDEACQKEIDRRESELYEAFIDLMDVVSYEYPAKKDEDDMLNDILDIISSYGYPVYRPMFMETDEGEVLVEYPYESVEEVSNK